MRLRPAARGQGRGDPGRDKAQLGGWLLAWDQAGPKYPDFPRSPVVSRLDAGKPEARLPT